MYTVVTRPYATFIVLCKSCFKTFLRKYYIDCLKVCRHFFKLYSESLISKCSTWPHVSVFYSRLFIILNSFEGERTRRAKLLMKYKNTNIYFKKQNPQQNSEISVFWALL